MVRCRYTVNQLKGEESRIAHGSEVSRLVDMAKPFASLDEMKRSAAKRLSLQQEVEKRKQEALAPSAERPISPASGAQREEVQDAIQVVSGTPHNRNKKPPEATLQQRVEGVPSRFAELMDDTEEDDE